MAAMWMGGKGRQAAKRTSLCGVAALTILLPGAAFAQTPKKPSVEPVIPFSFRPAAEMFQVTGDLLAQQPSAPTPPTPRPRSKPDTTKTGVSPNAVKPTEGFRTAPPGQRQPADPATVLTLAEALEVAFRRSPDVQLATERAVRTSRTVAQILALQRPQLSAGATYSRLSGPNAAGAAGGGGVSPAQVQNPFGVGLQGQAPGSIPITLSGGAGGGAGGGTGSAGATPPGGAGQFGQGSGGVTRAVPTTRQTGGQQPVGGRDVELNQVGARVTLSQLIDVTGIVRTAAQVGELQEAQSRLELARVRQRLALDVRSGYYNVLRTEAFVRVNEAAVAQAQEQLRVTQAQRAAGVASDFDVLRARTQLDNNRQALISARNQVAISKNAFANLIGLDPSTIITPQAPTAVPPLPALEETPLLEQAFSRRPEYLQADANILIAQKNVRLARRNLDPYVNANVSGTLNGTRGVPGDERAAAAIGLSLNVPIWDGGATRAAVDAARSDERGAQIQKDQFVRGIKAEVQQSIVAVRDANERASVAGQTVTQAREALRLANVRFRAGVGTQLEITDAQAALTQAETNAVNAQYDYLTALARLSRATGTPE